jgi:gliding motility-associated-like protein
MRRAGLMILFFVWQMSARSQLCTGSLGDPVAAITFGSGTGSQGQPLAPGKTNYIFQPSCPPDGNYNITNLSFGCFNQTWHTIVGDHTPNDAGGFYMLVNASSSPGIFYQDTVNGLCGLTTYEFSTYVMNVLKQTACAGNGIRPDLTFIVETLTGSQLVKYNTGEIPTTESPVWKQYGTFMTTPAGVSSVVIKLINNAPGGCGNDLALDDIQFRPCGPKVNVGINNTSVTDTTFCEGDSRVFTLQGSYSAGYTDPRVQWQETDDSENWVNIPGATATALLRQPTPRGTYRYRMLIAEGSNINSSCRIASTPITFLVTPPAFVTATNYVFGCLGSPVPFFASGANKYEWTGPNGFRSDLQAPEISRVQFRDSGLYIVKGTTNVGCVGYDSTYLQVFINVKVDAAPLATTCEGRPVTLNASGGFRYKWDPSAGLDNDTIPNPTVVKPLENTRYKIIATNPFGCFDTAWVQVNVLKLPKADAGPDIRMLRGRPVKLKSSVTGTDVSFTWSPVTDMANPGVAAPLVNPQNDTRYRLTVTSNSGCGISSDEVNVMVLDRIRVPNTFTPNGDGYNDNWQIDLLDLFENSVTEVFNPAGQRVYRDIGHGKPWDGTSNGKPLPAGTYYYVIDLKTNADRLTGFVTLLR